MRGEFQHPGLTRVITIGAPKRMQHGVIYKYCDVAPLDEMGHTQLCLCRALSSGFQVIQVILLEVGQNSSNHGEGH